MRANQDFPAALAWRQSAMQHAAGALLAVSACGSFFLNLETNCQICSKLGLQLGMTENHVPVQRYRIGRWRKQNLKQEGVME